MFALWALCCAACSGAEAGDGSAAGAGGDPTFAPAGSGGASGFGGAAGSAGIEVMASDGGATTDGAPAVSPGSCRAALPRVQAFEPARAAHGEALLRDETLAPGVLPEMVVRNLWVAWGTPAPANDRAFWAEVRARYGMIEAPFDNGGLPLGMRREAGGLTFDCMLCHGGRVAGTTLLGLANTTVDLEAFYEDLERMAELAPMFGFPAPPIPYDLEGLTFAAGAQDAFGLGFRFAGPAAAGLNTSFGPQQAPAWWLLQYKDRIYVDGSGEASGHHSMMATMVAFGITPEQLTERDEDFLDIAHHIRSLEPPCWSLSTLDPQQQARGQAIFEARCASCHGVHTGDGAAYPNAVGTLAELGTDPVRAQRFRQAEADRLNLSWFGEPPFEATGGYLAQPLAGIWARAPYFHNGSVPDLVGVLDSSQRPVRWRRLGHELEHYDAERVGLRHEVPGVAPDPGTREGRLVYDTTREGMGNGGHLFGDALTDAERSDLLEYLRGL